MIWVDAINNKPSLYTIVLCCLDERAEDFILGYYNGMNWKSADGKLIIEPLCYSILPWDLRRFY